MANLTMLALGATMLPLDPTITCRTDLIKPAGPDAEALWPGSLDESKGPGKGVRFNSYDDVYALAVMLLQKSGDHRRHTRRRLWSVIAVRGVTQ